MCLGAIIYNSEIKACHTPGRHEDVHPPLPASTKSQRETRGLCIGGRRELGQQAGRPHRRPVCLENSPGFPGFQKGGIFFTLYPVLCPFDLKHGVTHAFLSALSFKLLLAKQSSKLPGQRVACTASLSQGSEGVVMATGPDHPLSGLSRIRYSGQPWLNRFALLSFSVPCL